MAEKNVAYTYSQLESQNDQIPAATEPTAIEWCMMRRSAKWVYFISLFQIIFGIFCIIGAGGFLIGLLSVIFGSFGLSGARKRNVRYLTAHFVFTLAMYILALVSIVLMIIYCDNCPFFIYIIAFLFQIMLAVGMRHSRIFIALLKLYPQYQNTIATCHRNKNNTPVAVPMEVSTQTNIQSEQQIPMQFYPQMVAIPQQHVQGAAPLMTMAPIRYQQPFIQPMNGYPMYQQPNFPMGMQPYFAPFPVAPVHVQPPQDNNNNNNNNNNNSNSLYPNNNIPGVYRQV